VRPTSASGQAVHTGLGTVLRAVSAFGVGLAVACAAGLPMEAPQLVQPTAEEAAAQSPLTDLPRMVIDLLEPWEPVG
jgi:hypothetical protein